MFNLKRSDEHKTLFLSPQNFPCGQKADFIICQIIQITSENVTDK